MSPEQPFPLTVVGRRNKFLAQMLQLCYIKRHINMNISNMADILEEMDQIHEGRELFGSRMVKAGLITQDQCNVVLNIQVQLRVDGDNLRFGDIAIEQGFCSPDQIENMSGFIGKQMKEAGLLTPEQQDALVQWQSKLRSKGFSVRFGDLLVSEGFCTREEVEKLLGMMEGSPSDSVH